LDNPTPDEAREELLGRRLAESLPSTEEQEADPATAAVESWPLGETILDAILDEETVLSILIEIKEHGKSLSTATDSEVDRDVGLTIYYAAIASAILFHRQAITTYSFDIVAHEFEGWCKERWMNPKLAIHFTEARKACGKMK